MSFVKGFDLVLSLEGGYNESDLPGDPAGKTFAGITNGTWVYYCRQQKVDAHWPPSPSEVATFYQVEYWQQRLCEKLPEPADSVFLQCAVSLPFTSGNEVLQNALFVPPDADIGPVTQAEFGRWHPVDIAMRILVAQRQYYTCGASRYKAALIQRTNKVLAALNGGKI